MIEIDKGNGTQGDDGGEKGTAAVELGGSEVWTGWRWRWKRLDGRLTTKRLRDYETRLQLRLQRKNPLEPPADRAPWRSSNSSHQPSVPVPPNSLPGPRFLPMSWPDFVSHSVLPLSVGNSCVGSLFVLSLFFIISPTLFLTLSLTLFSVLFPPFPHVLISSFPHTPRSFLFHSFHSPSSLTHPLSLFLFIFISP